MAFEATKKEWCELYTFFRLLVDGKVVLGTAEVKAGEISWPVAMIQREEHDGHAGIILKKKRFASKEKQGLSPCLARISALWPN